LGERRREAPRPGTTWISIVYTTRKRWTAGRLGAGLVNEGGPFGRVIVFQGGQENLALPGRKRLTYVFVGVL
jgi:hypothetical protein